MKKLLLILVLSFVVLIGCTTSQQRTTYNTLAATEATATATVNGYFTAAVKGLADTNGIPKVAKAYNDFQAVMQIAVLVAKNNSNVLAPANVIQELSVVVSTVGQFTSTKVSVTP